MVPNQDLLKMKRGDTYTHIHDPTAQAENLRDSENRGVSSALESFRLRA